MVWKEPAETNGPIESYLLTFRREDLSTSVASSPTYHYYVIQPRDIPPGVGPVTVEVGAKSSASLVFK